MTSWMLYAVFGMLQSGLLMALFKVPAAKQINKYSLSAWTYFFSVLVALCALHSFIVFDIKTILFSFVWGTSLAVVSIAQMQALHKHDTSGVFPFTSLTSNVLVVIGGVLFLHNSISSLQWAAVALAVLLFVGAHLVSKKIFILEILPSFMFIALLSTFNKFVQNAGANHVEVHNFIFWNLLFTFAASLVMLFFVKKQITFSGLVHKHLIGWALLMGALQFGTNYTIVKALSLGPISLVFVVLGLYTFFTTIFAVLLFKEKITTKKIVFIILSFLVVLLIKLGS
jgi:uncharacterized membrane protein